VYPGAAELMQKEAEYTGLRTAQLKAKALADAQALADAGDYAAAIAQIRTAQQTYGDSTEYQNALAAFCTAYKSAVIAAADALAAAGDYLNAIARINEAAAVTGADEELTAKAKSYEDAYVSRVMAQNDAYIKADNYTAAEADINEALTVFPANAVLLARSEALKNSKPQLMLQVCPPYQTTMGYRARETYTMGGKAYANGFNLHYNSNGAAYFNLEQKYRLLSFDVGHIDGGLQQTGRYDFYLDGVLVKSLVLEPSMMVQRVDIPVRGASQLVVKAGKWCDHYALVNLMVTPDVLVK
jgi:tetratricopeptide (TPR) repeat protein